VKVRLNSNIDEMSDKLQTLIDRLYNNSIKPRLTNLEDVSAVVSVEDEETLLGFVALYETTEGFLTLGNYQCVNDAKVVQMLFEKVKQVAKQKGYTKLLGPMNGSTWNSYRFSVKNVAPFFLEHIHQPYYIKQWEAVGFKSCADYFTSREDLKAYVPNNKNLDWLNNKPQFFIRQFDINNAEKDLGLLHQFCCEAFKNNLLYTPISESAFKTLYQPILPYLKSDLIDLVMEKQNGIESLVGFLFAIENLYDPSQLIIKTVARKQGEVYKGMGNFLVERLSQKAKNKGCQKVLHAYMEGSNKSIQLSQKFGGEAHQEHLLFSLDL